MIKIDNKNIQYIRDAFSHFFPDNLSDFRDGLYRAGDFSWENRRNFGEFVFNETKVLIKSDRDFSSIKAAQQVFEKRATFPERPVEKDMPSKEVLESEAAEKQEAERQKLIKESKEEVKRVILKQQEIQKTNQDKLYVQVKEQKAKIASERLAQIEQLRNEAIKNPTQFQKDLSVKLEEQMTPALEKQMSKQEIKILADKVSLETTGGLINQDLYGKSILQAAIFEGISQKPELPLEIREAAKDLSTYTDFSGLSREVVRSINPDLSEVVFGNPKNFTITFFNEPSTSVTHTVDPSVMSQGYSDLLKNQLEIFDQIGSLSKTEAQNFLAGTLRNWVDLQVTKLPTVSAIYNSSESQVLMEAIGFGPAKAFGETWFGGVVLKIPGVPKIFEGLGKSTGIDFFGSAAGKLGGEALKEVGKDVALNAGTKAITTGGEILTGGGLAAAITAAVAPFTGPLAPIIGAVVAFVVQVVVVEIGKKVIGLIKDLAKKYGKYVAIGIAAIIGFIFYGGWGALLGGVGTYGGLSLLTGGLSGLQSSFSGLGAGIYTAIRAVWATFLGAIAIPIIGILLGVTLLVAFIIFIINSGAYVVPQGSELSNSTNPYISVEKKADPSGQLPSPTSITYTVTITAKKDTLTGITLKAECHATKKTGTINCPPEQMPTPPASINAGTPYSFSFTTAYGPQYQDSLVSNTITVTAVSSTGGQVTEIGSASVCFGKCPLDCFDLSDPSWSQQPTLKALLTGAASTLAGQYKDFAAKVCSGGTVKLCYNNSNPAAGGCTDAFARDVEDGKCSINFNKCVMSYGSEGTLFLLTHEATHHIQSINGYWQNLFDDLVFKYEPSVCSYGGANNAESMAEGNALFVAKPIIDQNGGCIKNYQSQYPKHYDFAKNHMFAP